MSSEALPRTRQEFLAATGQLLVVRAPTAAAPPAPGQPPTVAADPAEGLEILLAVRDDGRVIGLNGHVDLGTGIRTAFAQVVAEELDVALDRVEMVLGDTARVPNQGPTIASASIQLHSEPLRRAAAQARAFLVARACLRWGVPPGEASVDNGVVAHGERRAGFGALVAGERIHLMLDPAAPLKPVAAQRIVGRSPPRVDIPAKVAGEPVFVHDLRVPGMLHGRVVRPPYAGVDHGDFIGNTLESIDEASIAHIPGIRAVVVIRDFVGIVAEREENAEWASQTLKLRWRKWPAMPPIDDLAEAISAHPSTPRRLVDEGNVEDAIDRSAHALRRRYVWPYQMHASVGPSCALAHWHGESGAPALTVWSGTQNPHALRADLARLLQLPEPAVELIRLEAAGCYGRNGADDVSADAALLARAVGAPVRVQLSREQENLWDPKGAAQLMDVAGALGDDGSIAGWDFTTSYPSNAAPTLALLLTRTIEPRAEAYAMGDRTARPPYDVPNLRVTVNDMAPMLRAAWLRGVSALPNSFAHESFVDELASAAAIDPLQFRLRHLSDTRASDLLRETAERAGWLAHAAPKQQACDGDTLRGQGIAQARYVHSKWPGFGAAWSAWVADVEVDRRSGEVRVTRVVVGHDAGQMINPAGVRHQVHGNVVQTTSRALIEEVHVDPASHTPIDREWGSYPILRFPDLPRIEVLAVDRPMELPLGAGESSSVPGTAAIANAIFDATGVRFREPPFTAERVRAALNPLPPGAAGSAPPRAAPVSALPGAARRPGRRRGWTRVAALLAGAAGIGAALLGLRAPIAPVSRLDASIYTPATLERGRQLAALGNCAGCHTAPDGAPNGGGLAIDTPFGTIHSTNLTPDIGTGIGAWSFSAFQRAMREGVSRDGHLLYPAFPYTAFTRISDDDLTALYAYLMTQEPVRAKPLANSLRFPFNLRALMTVWNALFLDAGARQAGSPDQDKLWTRGEYLVNGLAHCGACHTDRNLLGAEREGDAWLGGAMIKGWEAPALTARSPAPVPWTEAALFDYLRHGHSAQHGAASGPMAPVVHELAIVPDEELRAMARYLASFNRPHTEREAADAAGAQVVAAARASAANAMSAGPEQRMFDAACSACHHDGEGPRLLGVNVPLALNTNLHSDRPDNLLRVILEGHLEPAAIEVGFMPAFATAFDDLQLARLVGWMRTRFAPDKPDWKDLQADTTRIRATPTR